LYGKEKERSETKFSRKRNSVAYSCIRYRILLRNKREVDKDKAKEREKESVKIGMMM